MPESTARPPETAGTRVRFFHEDPSVSFRDSFAYGMQEVFATRYRCKISVETANTHGPTGTTFIEIAEGFIERINILRDSLQNEILVYWRTAHVAVEHRCGRETMVPAMLCVVIAPKELLRYSFEALTDDLDEEESDRIAHLAIAASRLMPPMTGSGNMRELAQETIDAVREGLSVGHELRSCAETPLSDEAKCARKRRLN